MGDLAERSTCRVSQPCQKCERASGIGCKKRLSYVELVENRLKVFHIYLEKNKINEIYKSEKNIVSHHKNAELAKKCYVAKLYYSNIILLVNSQICVSTYQNKSQIPSCTV